VETLASMKTRFEATTAELGLALVIAIPVILFPAAFVWYLNVGGMFQAIKEARERKLARKAAPEKVVA